jgi:threonine synthase
MDISKASNFERFVFDLVGRDPAVIRQLWSAVDAGKGFDLSATPFFARLPEFGFVSGRSTHADRLATIRRTYREYGLMIDTHTADGLQVGSELRRRETPMVVLETALPAKFEETIRRSSGPKTRAPRRPGGDREAATTSDGDRCQRRCGEALHCPARRLTLGMSPPAAGEPADSEVDDGRKDGDGEQQDQPFEIVSCQESGEVQDQNRDCQNVKQRK